MDLRDDDGSACIGLHQGRPRIVISRPFVERYVRTPADLLHLLLHELMHWVRGDLRREAPRGMDERTWGALRNLAADMLVNAGLHATVPGGTPEYFRALYPRHSFLGNPAAAAVPVSRHHPGRARGARAAGAGAALRGGVRGVWRGGPGGGRSGVSRGVGGIALVRTDTSAVPVATA